MSGRSGIVPVFNVSKDAQTALSDARGAIEGLSEIVERDLLHKVLSYEDYRAAIARKLALDDCLKEIEAIRKRYGLACLLSSLLALSASLVT